jgi:DNA-binding transcriptional ArsR family regulator
VASGVPEGVSVGVGVGVSVIFAPKINLPFLLTNQSVQFGHTRSIIYCCSIKENRLMNVLYMAYSDSIVLEKLKQLVKDEPITCNEISEATGIPYRTVRRALKRLEELKFLKRTFRPGIGYWYEINGSDTT